MQYGYFDEVNKEYVITKPNTPAPWAPAPIRPAFTRARSSPVISAQNASPSRIWTL